MVKLSEMQKGIVIGIISALTIALLAQKTFNLSAISQGEPSGYLIIAGNH